MIELTCGNLLEANAEALVNTVNCVGVMGKGVALQFRQAFPENYEHYRQACEKKQVQPGQMLVWETRRLQNPRFIINFPTKRHWKGKSKLADVDAGLEALVQEITRLKIGSIAIPPLGCGHGGLDWNEVRPRIEQAMTQVPDVRVLLYEPAGAPASEHMPVATERPKLTRARAMLLLLLEQYTEPGYRLGRLEIQKLAYFLQEAGEPLKLQFVPHLYGPYAKALNHVLQRLEGHYIRGYGDRDSNSTIRLLPEGATAARRFLNEQPDAAAEERLKRVGSLIEGFETPYGMELLATVHWVAKQHPEAVSDAMTAVRLVHEWSQRKRDTFQSQHVFRAWDRLRGLNWLSRLQELLPAQHAVPTEAD